jgi:hypothetical protein
LPPRPWIRTTDTLAAELPPPARNRGPGREHEKILQDLGGARQALAALDGTSRAALLAETVPMGVMGRLQADVDRHVRLRLAALVMGREIERYRRDHQGPVLARAGEMFAGLTCGSFAGLEADFDERGDPVLQGVRSGGERVRVPGMSDGTRDQLFWPCVAGCTATWNANPPTALRGGRNPASTSTTSAPGEPAALGELARRTQVVFLHPSRDTFCPWPGRRAALAAAVARLWAGLTTGGPMPYITPSAARLRRAVCRPWPRGRHPGEMNYCIYKLATTGHRAHGRVLRHLSMCSSAWSTPSSNCTASVWHPTRTRRSRITAPSRRPGEDMIS